MKIVPIGFARTYYAKILEIHYNHGTQTKEQKVKEYKDLLDKVMAKVVTTRYKDGYDYIFSERRSDKNQKGTVSAILASCISLVIATRNEIEHNKITIDYILYKLCMKTLAETINFFSDESIIPEVLEIYDMDNSIQLPKISTHQRNIKSTAKKSPLILSTAQDTAETEIEKIKKRIPKWFNNPEQINSTILINFMQLKGTNSFVSYSDLEQGCKSVNDFKGNFNQMVNFGEKNHGKVFEWSDANVKLWQPVSAFIENQYKKIVIKKSSQ